MNDLHDPTKNGIINLPGAHQFTLTGFHWAGTPTREEFAKIRAFAESVDRANEWALGDLIVMEVKLTQRENRKKAVVDIIADFALRRGESVQTWERRYNVASFYPWQARVQELFWTHHRDIWASGVCAGSLTKAKEWLARALAEHWDVAELRAHLLAARRQVSYREPELPVMFPRELQDAIGWASARMEEVDALEPQIAAERYARLEPLLQYAERLRARATPALAGPPEVLGRR